MRHRGEVPIFRYAVIADTHMRPRNESSSPWKTNLMANDRARWVACSVNNEDSDLVFHLGDVVHPVPQLAIHASASEVAREIMGNIAAPVVYVPGNHDVGDKVNPTVPAHKVNNGFIKYFRETYGPTYQSFTHKGIRFVTLNSPVLNSGLEEEKQQRSWLIEELESHRDMRIHMFSHYPPYLHVPGEDSNYDNVDPPGRGWLLGLLKEYSVEAFFAGHVHHFFYKRHHRTDLYNMLATGNLRQDLANLFRVDPGVEFGRDDNAKLGYCIVDVYTDGHVVGFHRSYGSTLCEGMVLEKKERIGSEGGSGALGVHIRYPLGEVVTLPYMGPLDEFNRKQARNDYPLMALWESGIGTLRLPIGDLLDENSHQLYTALQHMGYRLGFFSVGVPPVDLVSRNRDLIDFVEVITPWTHVMSVLAEADGLRSRTGVSVYLANISSSLNREQSGGKFSHFMGFGFRSANMDVIDDVLSDLGCVDGFVFEVGEQDSPIETLEEIHGYSSSHGFKALVNIRLAAEDPAVYPRNDISTANRVAETMVAAHKFPQVRTLFDTFMDHDRGYFPRCGFYDRLLNPRRAAVVLRSLDAAFTRFGGFTMVSGVEEDEWSVHRLEGSEVVYSLRLPMSTESEISEVDGTVIDLTSGVINPSRLNPGSQHLVIQQD